MRVYAVLFCANGICNVFPEAYSSLEAAQRFIEKSGPLSEENPGDALLRR